LPNENIAGLLCYVVGWITGLIFFLTDKRPFVRFHAAQSIVVFGGLNILQYLFGIFFGFRVFGMPFGGFSFAAFLLRAIDLLALVLWILCMAKAYQGVRFRVPLAADIAERIFGKL
jgi:uncharacterized membrane protein